MGGSESKPAEEAKRGAKAPPALDAPTETCEKKETVHVPSEKAVEPPRPPDAAPALDVSILSLLAELSLADEEARRLRAEVLPPLSLKEQEEYLRDMKVTKKYLSSLQELGLTYVPVPKDNNCLFTSVSQIMYGTIEHHAQLRRLTVEFIAEHPLLCLPVDTPKGVTYERAESIIASRKDLAHDMNSYVQIASRDGELGDDICLHALGNIYNRYPIVYFKNVDDEGNATQHDEFSAKDNASNLPLMYLHNVKDTEEFEALENEQTRSTRITTAFGEYEKASILKYAAKKEGGGVLGYIRAETKGLQKENDKCKSDIKEIEAQLAAFKKARGIV